MRDTGHRDRHGELLYALTMRELEALPGFHREGGSHRACCPAHGGDNPNALRVNNATGAGHCFRCHASFVVEDHPEQIARVARFNAPTITLGGRTIALPRAQSREDAPGHAPRFKTHRPKREAMNVAPEAKERLATALARFAAALPGSPGAAYLAGRGIPLDAAAALGVGWAAGGYFAGRVVFPLTAPDGVPTGATGRTIAPDADPKYKAARTADGYAKTLANGGAIARATASGGSVIVVEGPMDALAIVAGGLMNVVAIGSTSYPWPAHFRGVKRAVLLLDNDGAGVKGGRAFRDALALEGVAATLLDALALGEHKDAAAYWEARGELPPALLDALAMEPAASRSAGFARRTGAASHTVEPSEAIPAAKGAAVQIDVCA